jgi:hypothetical protein
LSNSRSSAVTGAGDVVQDQVRLEAEEVAELVIERLFDPLLGSVQLIECAIPGRELAGVHPDPLALVPVRHEATTRAIANEVGLQPAGEPLFAGGTDQPIGDEHKRSVGERDVLGSPQAPVEDAPEAKLVKQGPDSQYWPPSRGVDDFEVAGGAVLRFDLSAEQAPELGQHRQQHILPAEVRDDALLDLAIFAVGFDDADVLVEGAVTGADLDRSGVHERARASLAKRIRRVRLAIA